ncbi:ribonuclease H-like domain-containing protein [Tanacetum coccineum]
METFLGQRRLTKKINVHLRVKDSSNSNQWAETNDESGTPSLVNSSQEETSWAKKDDKEDQCASRVEDSSNTNQWGKTNDESGTPRSQSGWKTSWAKKDDKEDQCASRVEDSSNTNQWGKKEAGSSPSSSGKWAASSIHQLDVNNAFFHGNLVETFKMHQLPGFINPAHPEYVYHLQKSLNGLKQAPRTWFQPITSYVIRVSFQDNESIFIFHWEAKTAYLLLYEDDIILTTSSSALLERILSSLHAEFVMTNLGPFNYFLGITVVHTTHGLFISRSKYATEILEQTHMLNCSQCRTQGDIEKKLEPEGDLVVDPTLYCSLVSALYYLTFTGPDLPYSVQQLCLICMTHESNIFMLLGVANVVAETACIRNLLPELRMHLFTSTFVYWNNVSVVYMSMSANHVQY